MVFYARQHTVCTVYSLSLGSFHQQNLTIDLCFVIFVYFVCYSDQWRYQGCPAGQGLCPGCKPLCHGCAPAGKPSSLHYVMQHQFSHKIPCIILHTNANILTLMTPEDRILKAIFKKPCEVTPPTAFATRSYTQLQHMAVCRAQDAPSAWTQTIVPLKLVCSTCAPANSWLCH